MDAARLAPRVIPKGVHRYRSHAEANAAMDRWIVEGVVQRAEQLRRSSVPNETLRLGLAGRVARVLGQLLALK